MQGCVERINTLIPENETRGINDSAGIYYLTCLGICDRNFLCWEFRNFQICGRGVWWMGLSNEIMYALVFQKVSLSEPGVLRGLFF